MDTSENQLPFEYRGPDGAGGHHGWEYLNITIDVSDVDTIKFSKDHNLLRIDEVAEK